MNVEKVYGISGAAEARSAGYAARLGEHRCDNPD